jgi:hypothetical protein
MSLNSQTTNKQVNCLSSVATHNKSVPTNNKAIGVPIFLQKSANSLNPTNNHQNHRGIGDAINHSRRSGSMLPHSNKAQFESASGTDLSAVRVHNDPQHNQLARSLNAKAFTVGSDIFFGAGHYRPGSRAGDRLLAHELTHVAQQSEGAVQAKQLEPGLYMGDSDAVYEQEADRVADELISTASTSQPRRRQGIYGARAAGSGISTDVIQRDDEEDEQGFDYNLLPPSLAYRHGPFGMSADTSAAQLSYFSDEGRTNLGYQYGGDLFYGANLGGFRSRFGVNPQSGVGSMSMGGSHGGFNYGVGGNTAGGFNLGLGYGAPLLPMPGALGQQAGAAWQGAYAMGGAMPDFMSDPLAGYQANRENIGAIGTFGSSLGNIYGQQGEGGLPFGAGVNISYNPEQQWVFGAGVQGSF